MVRPSYRRRRHSSNTDQQARPRRKRGNACSQSGWYTRRGLAMNFLVTGAAGFLGSALANRLAREGHQVRGLDDLSAGDPQRLEADVLFTRGDVTDRPKLWT